MSNQTIELVKEMIAAESCYEKLRAAGQEYLEAAGTDKEADATEKLLKRLEADVNPIEDSIGFFKSDLGKQVFGDAVDGMISSFEKARDEGEDTCLCPASQAGKKLLVILK